MADQPLDTCIIIKSNITINTMKKVLYLMTLIAAALCNRAAAQDSPVFPKGEPGKNTDNYTGTVWLAELTTPDTIFNLSLAQATFAPGSKLDWHIHPAGQYLLITSGTGYYQEKGKPVQLVHKGDVIKCMPGVEHWHAASPESGFSYIGVTPTQKGKTIWKKRVTDEEYNSVKSTKGTSSDANKTNAEQEIVKLSKQKWDWMADKNVDSLNALFDEKSVFVHMGGSWGKQPELNTIKSGGIWYKKADVHSVSVNIIGNTAILLNNITLLAVVGGNEVTNPFIVTEVYIKENGRWMLGSLSFTKKLTPDDRKQ
jgi:4-carboxymuconolactone decarboxylase